MAALYSSLASFLFLTTADTLLSSISHVRAEKIVLGSKGNSYSHAIAYLSGLMYLSSISRVIVGPAIDPLISTDLNGNSFLSPD